MHCCQGLSCARWWPIELTAGPSNTQPPALMYPLFSSLSLHCLVDVWPLLDPICRSSDPGVPTAWPSMSLLLCPPFGPSRAYWLALWCPLLCLLLSPCMLIADLAFSLALICAMSSPSHVTCSLIASCTGSNILQDASEFKIYLFILFN